MFLFEGGVIYAFEGKKKRAGRLEYAISPIEADRLSFLRKGKKKKRRFDRAPQPLFCPQDSLGGDLAGGGGPEIHLITPLRKTPSLIYKKKKKKKREKSVGPITFTHEKWKEDFNSSKKKRGKRKPTLISFAARKNGGPSVDIIGEGGGKKKNDRCISFNLEEEVGLPSPGKGENGERRFTRVFRKKRSDKSFKKEKKRRRECCRWSSSRRKKKKKKIRFCTSHEKKRGKKKGKGAWRSDRSK